MKCIRFTQLFALAVLASLLLASKSQALLSNPHITDGIVAPGEWNNPGVTFVDFSQSEAGLYAQEVTGPNSSTLYLLYDYYGHPASAVGGSSFNVFFQVPGDADYLVNIQNGNFSAYEKPPGTPAPDNPFVPTAAPWTPLSSSDLALANFAGVESATTNPFGTDPGDNAQHLLAEFQLSVNTTGGSSNPNGIYSPDAAFWSASQDDGALALDPPISSGIFTLNPAGGPVGIVPALGPNGDPVFQPEEVVPEPSTLALLGLGSLGLLVRRKFARSVIHC
jgi:hypothetical protein